mmetsp:Transcript_7844/g.25609  ORF Transcript_7844/g.25609 Transcript_7844/m.25609 type:complete len:286 (-) Transcript_7844:636-1493(-)
MDVLCVVSTSGCAPSCAAARRRRMESATSLPPSAASCDARSASHISGSVAARISAWPQGRASRPIALSSWTRAKWTSRKPLDAMSFDVFVSKFRQRRSIARQGAMRPKACRRSRAASRSCRSAFRRASFLRACSARRSVVILRAAAERRFFSSAILRTKARVALRALRERALVCSTEMAWLRLSRETLVCFRVFFANFDRHAEIQGEIPPRETRMDSAMPWPVLASCALRISSCASATRSCAAKSEMHKRKRSSSRCISSSASDLSSAAEAAARTRASDVCTSCK